MSGTRLDFGNLPLIEAALRVSLSSPMSLTYAVVGSLARRLENEFPAVSEPKQIEIAPGVGPSPAELGPSILPGAVYTGHVQGLSISIHSQVIVTRWTKQFGPQEKTYPRFSALRDALWNAIRALSETIGDEFPPILVVNMSYANFVGEPEGALGIRAYLSDRALLLAMERARQVRKLEAAWTEDDSVDVRFALEQVTARLGDEVEDGYRLTTAAGKRLAAAPDAKKDLEHVHERLQAFFLDLISEKAKEEWKLTVVPDA